MKELKNQLYFPVILPPTTSSIPTSVTTSPSLHELTTGTTMPWTSLNINSRVGQVYVFYCYVKLLAPPYYLMQGLNDNFITYYRIRGSSKVKTYNCDTGRKLSCILSTMLGMHEALLHSYTYTSATQSWPLSGR